MKIRQDTQGYYTVGGYYSFGFAEYDKWWDYAEVVREAKRDLRAHQKWVEFLESPTGGLAWERAVGELRKWDEEN